MSDIEPIALFGTDTNLRAFRRSNKQSFKANHSGSDRSKSTPPIRKITFNRQELNCILSIYGRRVAMGEWRDYAIYHGGDRAIFSIFRRSREMSLYTVEKRPDHAKKQCIYTVIAAGGVILRRSHNLMQVLLTIDRGPRLVPAQHQRPCPLALGQNQNHRSLSAARLIAMNGFLRRRH